MRAINYYREINNDKRLSMVLGMVILCLFVVNLSAGVSELTKIDYTVVSSTLKVFLALIILFSVGVILGRLNTTAVTLIIISLAVTGLNFVLFPQNNPYFLDTILDYWMICMPLMLIILLISDYYVLLETLTKFSLLIAGILSLSIVYIYLFAHVPFNSGRYSMGFSYACILPCLSLLWDFFTRKRLTSVMGAVVLILAILLFGSRGAILCLLVFCIICLFRRSIISNSPRKFIILFAFFAAMCIFYQPLLSAVQDILSVFGINSRTIALFLNHDGIYLSGRDSNYSSIILGIKKSPFQIRGINADFILLSSYSHNIVLELLYEFGLALGIPILAVIAYFSVKTVFNSRLTPENDVRLVLFCIAMPSLMVSGTLWTSYFFWMWIALSIKKSAKNKKITLV